MEERRLKFDLRSELKLAFPVPARGATSQTAPPRSIGGLNGPGEELLEILLAAHFLLGKGGDFIDEPLDSRARRFDAGVLCHELGMENRGSAEGKSKSSALIYLLNECKGNGNRRISEEFSTRQEVGPGKAGRSSCLRKMYVQCIGGSELRIANCRFRIGERVKLVRFGRISVAKPSMEAVRALSGPL